MMNGIQQALGSLWERVKRSFTSRVFEIWKDPDFSEAVRPPGLSCYSGEGGKVLYLRRITLIEVRGWRLCLHFLYRSDEDADPHDHPWDFWTMVLRRPYLDQRWIWDGDERRGPTVSMMPWFWPVKRAAEHIHRVIRIPGEAGPTWTLVLMAPPRRAWGFVKETGWVYWRTYLGIPHNIPLRED